MPEMPEVETVCRSLAHYVENKTITDVDILLPRLVKFPSAEEFRRRIVGQTVARLRRTGKYIRFLLSDDSELIIHLRMTGELHYSPDGAADWPRTRLIFRFADGAALLYADGRTLGALYAVRGDEIKNINGLVTMGPEPLSAEFTEKYLAAALQGKKTKLKSWLLDQKNIGGLGNIYVDEALFAAKLHPLREAGDLNKAEIKRLYAAINSVIAAGVADGGTTFSDYRDADGNLGRHQENLRAFQRTGKPCFNCGTPLEKIRVGGRGTHFCPKCQKAPAQTKIIGLTGGIACGKSTVSAYLREQGIPVVDADAISHQLAEPGESIWRAYVEHFGESVLDADRTLKRQAIADIAFRDPAEKKWLDSALHPLIKARVQAAIKKYRRQKAKVVVLDVPLLYEAGWDDICDAVWVVAAGVETQLARITRRDGISREQAADRIRNQMSVSEKARRADVVINNDKSVEETQKQAARELQKLLRK